ncbi:hypothetical protein [Roseibium alexandrii]|uniref:hypothetical protein n=1 Tax=Roseibium alexandrii TaxID=388408 RepID=UPI0037525A06
MRERPSDIPKLIDHFLKKGAAKAGTTVPIVSADALDALLCWSYPGNVRELKNILDRARLMAEAGYPIQLEHPAAGVDGTHEWQCSADAERDPGGGFENHRWPV